MSARLFGMGSNGSFGMFLYLGSFHVGCKGVWMIMMVERSILFNGEMVRAILDGRKTQTRRVVNEELITPLVLLPTVFGREPNFDSSICPFGKPDDRLWVKEEWCHESDDDESARAAHEDLISPSKMRYRATEIYPESLRWRPLTHMPRWACRIVLEITDVRVERLQDASWSDIHLEGHPECCSGGFSGVGIDGEPIECDQCTTAEGPMRWFIPFWNSIQPKHPWDTNPFVFVLSFKRVEE